MQSMAGFSQDARSRIRGVFCDIDDTLTTEGRLTAGAYSALEKLHDAGFLVVPITGRPAGWCDHIARMWPVDGVVGENGALYFRYDHGKRRMHRRFVDDDVARAAKRARLTAIRDRILEAVAGCAVASDQHYRETDLAIDHCEDVQKLSVKAIDMIVGLMRASGLTAKVSSIHVNGWFGDYDKLSMTELLMSECINTELDGHADEFVFVGDSPNDAPMFAYFPHAVGVANIRAFAGRIESEPAYVTEAANGAGFCQVVDFLLAGQHASETPEDVKNAKV